MAIIIGRLEHGSGASFAFILEHIWRVAQGIPETHLVSPYWMTPPDCTNVSIADNNEVSQLYEVARLKLTIARLSDEHIYKASTTPLVGRG
ncbi:hypothetical protein JCGZ_25144 [Jatropha curcas]|uniref:Uncharacterized protein n=1 Tax=Jatropha curcas TaxID=180498 RepID=A0A067LGL2_JATCU|nr:hypothetical protein JCGZ_25144 [Jatropha curcas]